MKLTGTPSKNHDSALCSLSVELDDQHGAVLVLEERSALRHVVPAVAQRLEDVLVTGYEHRVAAPTLGLVGTVSLTIRLREPPLRERAGHDSDPARASP